MGHIRVWGGPGPSQIEEFQFELKNTLIRPKSVKLSKTQDVGIIKNRGESVLQETHSLFSIQNCNVCPAIGFP